MRRFTPYMVVFLTFGLGGCSGSDEQSPGSPTPAPSDSSALADDPPGRFTCRNLATAVRNGSLMEPGVVEAIVGASGTADAPVADAAAALGQAYGKALTSHGTLAEPDAIAAVSAAAADMSQVCADSGLDSAN